MIDLPAEIREMRCQLVDCFPDEADDIMAMPDDRIVRGAARHFGLREWACGGDPEDADGLYYALIDAMHGTVSA